MHTGSCLLIARTFLLLTWLQHATILVACCNQLKNVMVIIDPAFTPSNATVQQLRNFSRKLVRELGLMRSTLAGTELAPSAVHAVIEIGTSPGINAKDLAVILRLDKSSTSRQIAKLETQGLIQRTASNTDARSSALYLTAEGKKLKTRIDQYATSQVSSALRHIAPADQKTLVRSLALYADALGSNHSASVPEGLSAGISEGYQPGCIGDISSLHARFYSKNWGFGSFFEQKVATELAEFTASLPMQGKALWLYMENDRVLASVAIDGNLATGVAHLRWFIVDDSLRGSGIGRQLMLQAMQFVDQRFKQTYLWTFKGLDAARHLYESYGFKLMQQHEGSQWGTHVIEQQFIRSHAPII